MTAATTVPSTINRSAAIAAAAVGLLCLGNGLAMLARPLLWFWSVPGVALTGAYNAHLVRDVGLAYLLAAAAMLAGLLRPTDRALLWSAAAAWLIAHAGLHLAEVAAGLCGPSAIPRDFLGVTLPGLVAAALAIHASRGRT